MAYILFVEGRKLTKESAPVVDDFNVGLLSSMRVRTQRIEKLPKTFRTDELDKWPTKSKNKCFRCGCAMTYRQPCPAPRNMQMVAPGVYEFDVDYVVCSWACNNTELQTQKSQISRDEFLERHNFMSLAYQAFVGESAGVFPLAPDKRRLERYGGNMSDKDWQELVQF